MQEFNPRDYETRFWKYVSALSDDECWIWMGSLRRGYGRISIRHSYSIPAHRFSWELHRGSIPNGLDVCHTCDVPACVNPNHLFLGTAKDNIRDMILKERDNFRGLGPVNKSKSSITQVCQ